VKRRLASALALALLVAWGSLEALAAPAKAPYLGTWTDHLSRAEMYDRGFDAQLAGPFRLVLRPNGTYTTFNWYASRPSPPSRGTYTVSGRRIVFANDVECSKGGFEGKGVYTWALSKGRLRLVQPYFGSDPCGGRWQALTYPIWKKKT
jgi:hypothetical protein